MITIEKKPIIKPCDADECEGYHEGSCIMDVLHPGYDSSKCDVKSNADLIPACVVCEINPADAGFPFDDMCKDCAKEAEKDFEEP